MHVTGQKDCKILIIIIIKLNNHKRKCLPLLLSGGGTKTGQIFQMNFFILELFGIFIDGIRKDLSCPTLYT